MAEPIYEGIAWIYKMLITLIVAVVAIGVVAYSVKQETNARDVQLQLLLNRILYSPDGFWYTTTEGLSKPGIADKNQIENKVATQFKLDNNFNYPDGYGGARVTFIPWDQNVNQQPLYGPFYIEQRTFETLSAQIEAGQKGTGVYEQHTFPVVIRRAQSDGTYIDSAAYMRVEVVVPERA